MSKQDKQEGKIDPEQSMAALASKTSASVSFVEVGKNVGTMIRDAVQGAFKTQRELMLKYAEELGLALGVDSNGLHETAKQFLDGYGYVMGKIRKSEFSQVMVAATVKQKKMENPVQKYRKGILANGEDETKEYVNVETKDGMDWLKEATSYEQLISIARDVKGASSGGSRTKKAKQKLADKSFDKVLEETKVASPSQAGAIAAGALDSIHKSTGGDRMLLMQTIGICRRLAMSKDEFVKTKVTEMANIASDLIARLELNSAGVSNIATKREQPTSGEVSTVVAPQAAVAETTQAQPEKLAA